MNTNLKDSHRQLKVMLHILLILKCDCVRDKVRWLVLVLAFLPGPFCLNVVMSRVGVGKYIHDGGLDSGPRLAGNFHLRNKVTYNSLTDLRNSYSVINNTPYQICYEPRQQNL